MKRKFTLLAIALLLVGVHFIQGQDLIYKPKNPAFGGDPFNYQWLLSSAQEQNDYKEKSGALYEQDPLKQFEEDLNRQILSQLTRRLVSDVFGEEGLKDGTFLLGGFQIDVGSYPDGVHINILNINNGSETSIIVPFF